MLDFIVVYLFFFIEGKRAKREKELRPGDDAHNTKTDKVVTAAGIAVVATR